MKTEKQVLAELRKRCDKTSQTAVAKELGFKVQFLHDVLTGRKRISARLADRLGYRRIKTVTVRFEAK